jgi:hypothetical protein
LIIITQNKHDHEKALAVIRKENELIRERNQEVTKKLKEDMNVFVETMFNEILGSNIMKQAIKDKKGIIMTESVKTKDYP